MFERISEISLPIWSFDNFDLDGFILLNVYYKLNTQ